MNIEGKSRFQQSKFVFRNSIVNVSSRAGFTLLELLISISILGLMIIILMGVLRLGVRSVESGEKKIAASERIRIALNMIDAQIRSAFPLTREVNGENKFYFKGERTSLELTTHYSIWEGEIGYCLVSYRLVEGERNKWALWASEGKAGQEIKREIKLLDGLDNLSFEYFYKDPTESQGKWVEQWTEEKFLPEKIRLQATGPFRLPPLIFQIKTGWSSSPPTVIKKL